MANEIEKTNEVTEKPSDVESFGIEMDKVLNADPAGEAKDKVSADTKAADKVGKDTFPEKDEDATSAEDATSDETDTELATEDIELLEGINSEVLDVCRDYGWTDAKIAQVAKLTPELLEDVRDLLDEETESLIEKKASKTGGDEPAKTETQKAIEELKFSLDPDIHGKELVDAINKIAEKVNRDSKGLSDEQTRLQTEREQAFNLRIDSCLDRHTKDLPDLGNSSNLTKHQGLLRRELFAHANVTASIRGIPIEKAIEIETRKLKNQDGEKVAGQKLLNKLDGQRKRFTHAPTRRHSDTGIAGRKFATEEEMKEAVMSEAYKEAGIDE